MEQMDEDLQIHEKWLVSCKLQSSTSLCKILMESSNLSNWHLFHKVFECISSCLFRSISFWISLLACILIIFSILLGLGNKLFFRNLRLAYVLNRLISFLNLQKFQWLELNHKALWFHRMIMIQLHYLFFLY